MSDPHRLYYVALSTGTIVSCAASGMTINLPACDRAEWSYNRWDLRDYLMDASVSYLYRSLPDDGWLSRCSWKEN